MHAWLADRPVGDQTPSHKGVTKDFFSADFATKLELVQELANLWDLAISGTSEPLKITEDEVEVAEVSGTCPLLPSSLLLVFVFLSFSNVV